MADEQGAIPEAIEAAARAMCDRVNGIGDYDENIEQRRSGWVAQARAGIAAYLAAHTPDSSAVSGSAEGLREAVEALKPFAAYADPRKAMPASMPVTQGSGMARRQITMGDCYAASNALAALTGGHGS